MYSAILAQIYQRGDDDVYHPFQFPGRSYLYTGLKVSSNSQQSVSISLPDALPPGDYYLQLSIANDFHSTYPSDYFAFAGGPIAVEAPTGVDAVLNGQSPKDKGPFFDLSGRRVQQPRKGVYINNGKQVVIK